MEEGPSPQEEGAYPSGGGAYPYREEPGLKPYPTFPVGSPGTNTLGSPHIPSNPWHVMVG